MPFLQTIFQTEALALNDILTLICLSSTVLIVDECFKLFLRAIKCVEDNKSNSEEAKSLIP